MTPDPNVANSTIFASTPVTDTRTDQFDVRLDHLVSPNMTLFGRYSFVDTLTFRPAPLEGLAEGSFNDAFGANDMRSQGLALGLTWTVSPTLVGDIRFGYSRGDYYTTPPNYGVDGAAAIGLKNVPSDPAITGRRAQGQHAGVRRGWPAHLDAAVPDPALVEPARDVQPQSRRPLPQVRRRVPPRADADQRSERDDWPDELREPVHQPRRRRSAARPAVAAGPHQLHRHGSGAGHAVLLRPGRLSRLAEADGERRPALRVRHAAARAGQSVCQLRSRHRDDDLRERRRHVRARADPSRPEQLRAADRVRVHPGVTLGRARRLRCVLHPHGPAGARRAARFQPALSGRQPAADRRHGCGGRGLGGAVPAGRRLSIGSARSDNARPDHQPPGAGRQSANALHPAIQHRRSVPS